MSNKIKVSAAGLFAGIILGLFLKLVQSLTGLKVYTLLLNVDYIPILKNYKFSEINEFFLHLVISMALGFFVYEFLKGKLWSNDRKKILVLKLSLVVGLLLYPTTMFSGRTPTITSTNSFLLWMAGHALYGIILGKMLIFIKEEQPRG